MKKIIALLLVLCALMSVTSALAAKEVYPDFSGFSSHVPSGINISIFKKPYYSCSFFDARYVAFIETKAIDKNGTFLRVYMSTRNDKGVVDGQQHYEVHLVAKSRYDENLYIKNGEHRYAFFCEPQYGYVNSYVVLSKSSFAVLEEIGRSTGDVYIQTSKTSRSSAPLNPKAALTADQKAMIQQFCADVRASGIYDSMPETDSNSWTITSYDH